MARNKEDWVIRGPGGNPSPNTMFLSKTEKFKIQPPSKKPNKMPEQLTSNQPGGSRGIHKVCQKRLS